MKKHSDDVLNKTGENLIEQSIGMPIPNYIFKDLRFDSCDTNVDVNMEAVEELINTKEPEIRNYSVTKKSGVYNNTGYVDEAMTSIQYTATLDQTIEILGLDTLENKFRFDITTIVGAVKSRRPGSGSPLHIDRYTNLVRYNVKDSVADTTGRWIIHLQDWNWGEFCQVDNRIMVGWQAGDSYQVPTGVPHLAVNYGIRNRNFLSVTGELKD